jgi:hypothetical protein
MIFKLKIYLLSLYIIIRFGKITEKVTATSGHGVPSEIEYINGKGKVIGFWAYGSWHPDFPYKGGDLL